MSSCIHNGGFGSSISCAKCNCDLAKIIPRYPPNMSDQTTMPDSADVKIDPDKPYNRSCNFSVALHHVYEFAYPSETISGTLSVDDKERLLKACKVWDRIDAEVAVWCDLAVAALKSEMVAAEYDMDKVKKRRDAFQGYPGLVHSYEREHEILNETIRDLRFKLEVSEAERRIMSRFFDRQYNVWWRRLYRCIRWWV